MSGRASSWAVALVAFAVAIAGATWWTIDRGQDQNPSWLFSHTASAGSLKQNANGGYTLTLTGIDPHVMAFTDRPKRDSAIMPASELIEQWPTLFADSPPNAVLVEHNAKGKTDSVVLTLTNPNLTATALTFDAVVIKDEHPANLKRLTRGIHKSVPANFANASLFIDDVGGSTVTWYCVYGYDESFTEQTFSLPTDQASLDQFINDCYAVGDTPTTTSPNQF